MSKVLENKETDPDFAEIIDKSSHSIKIQRNLNIHQKGVKVQLVTLKVVLFYPKLTVSSHVIVFDNVYIGNKEKHNNT